MALRYFIALCFALSATIASAQNAPELPPDIPPPIAPSPPSQDIEPVAGQLPTATQPQKAEGQDGNADKDSGFFSFDLPSFGSLFGDDDATEEVVPKPVEIVAPENTPTWPLDAAIRDFHQYQITDDEAPAPARKPLNYNRQRLPSYIYKKNYRSENSHLPKARYEEEEHRWVFESAANGRVDVLRTLIQKYKTTEFRDDEGSTPLLVATMAQNEKTVRTLLDLNANVDTQNRFGLSPLYVAAFAGNESIIALLLLHHADPNISEKTGMTPLMAATRNGNVGVMLSLLGNGAHINARRKNGDTALHIAILHKNAALVDLLLQKGAYVNARNYQGFTPLMLAATQNQFEAAQILLSAGADPNKRTTAGSTAYDLAIINGNNNIAQFLEGQTIKRKIETAKLIKLRQNTKYHEPETFVQKPAFPIPALRPEGLFSKRSLKTIPIPQLRPL